MSSSKWESVIRRHYASLCDKVSGKTILPYLTCLTKCDKEKIQCDLDGHGNSVGMQTLLDRLQTRDPRVYYNQLMIALYRHYDYLAREMDPTFNPDHYDSEGRPRPSPQPTTPSTAPPLRLQYFQSSLPPANNLSTDNGNTAGEEHLTSMEDNTAATPSIQNTYTNCVFTGTVPNVQIGDGNVANIEGNGAAQNVDDEVEEEQEESYEIVRGDPPVDEEAETERLKLGCDYSAVRPRDERAVTKTYESNIAGEVKEVNTDGANREMSSEKILNTDPPQDEMEPEEKDPELEELDSEEWGKLARTASEGAEKDHFRPKLCGDTMPDYELNLEVPNPRPPAPCPPAPQSTMIPPVSQESFRTDASGSTVEFSLSLSNQSFLDSSLSTTVESNSSFELPSQLSTNRSLDQQDNIPSPETPQQNDSDIAVDGEVGQLTESNGQNDGNDAPGEPEPDAREEENNNNQAEAQPGIMRRAWNFVSAISESYRFM